VRPGDWLAFEANGDEHEEMWIGRAVPIGDDDVCVHKVLKRSTIEGVQYSKGEYRINVVFYDRCGKRQYSVSRPLQDKLVSSSTLRMILGDMKVLNEPRITRSRRRRRGTGLERIGIDSRELQRTWVVSQREYCSFLLECE
jgi:hypothetical protein